MARTTFSTVRPVWPAMVCAAAMLVSGCASSSGGDAQEPGPDNPSVGVVTLDPNQQPQEPQSPDTPDEAAAVSQAMPNVEADCPYLSAEEAEEAVGEKVTRVDIDPNFDPAACFFTTIDGSISLVTTLHTVSDEQQASALVEEAAPAATTERVDIGSWSGGKTAAAFGALLAVQRGNQVFVAQSTQNRSMAVQRVAELVIPRIEG